MVDKDKYYSYVSLFYTIKLPYIYMIALHLINK